MCSILCGDQHSGADKVATAVRDGGEYLVAPSAKYRVAAKAVVCRIVKTSKKQRVNYSIRKHKNYRKKKVNTNKKAFVGEKERKLCKQHIIETPIIVA